MTTEQDHIGRYRVLSRLGAGGMGEVFLCHDDSLDRRVAIKRLLPDTAADPHAVARLMGEARAVAKLEHPGICGIYEVSQDDKGPFIVMPVVEGQTLAARLATGVLPLKDAIDLGAQIAGALAHAHSQGILHRDIKPANIIVNARGEARVMDFGLAKVALGAISSVDPTQSLLTQEGTTLGTAQYMAPEQARGQRTDARSDIFSAGVVLYEMIAGRKPFDGASLTAILVATQTEEPAAIARFRPDAPDELQRIVSKALRKSPDERYQSANDLAIDLRALARASGERPVTVAAPGRTAGAVPRSSRLALAVLAVAVVAVGVGGFMWLRPTPHATLAAAGGRPDIDSLAVLPLVNDTGNPDKEYLADGVTESLIRSLSQLPALKVLSRNTAFRFKGKTDDAQRIAGELAVSAVVTGRVKRADDQLVIDVELMDAHATVILTQEYVEPASRAQTVPSDIAQDVARHLRAKLTGDAERAVAQPPTTSSEAYQLYLRGRFFIDQESPESVHQAISFFEQSVALDPHFALAYASLAQAYLETGLYYDAPMKAMPEAKRYANLSLAADPTLVDGRIVLGLVALVYDWDWAAAAKATTVNGMMLPEAISMFSCATHLLESTGHSKEAESELQEALVINPLSTTLKGELGCVAYYRRHYDEAIRGYREAIALDPKDPVALWGLGKSLNQEHQYQQTVSDLETFGDGPSGAPPIILSALGCAYASLGDTPNMNRILKILTAMSAKVFVDPYLVASIYAAHHDKARALDLLDEAFTLRSGMLTSLGREPQWDAIRDEPRFKDLQKRVGI